MKNMKNYNCSGNLQSGPKLVRVSQVAPNCCAEAAQAEAAAERAELYVENSILLKWCDPLGLSWDGRQVHDQGDSRIRP